MKREIDSMHVTILRIYATLETTSNEIRIYLFIVICLFICSLFLNTEALKMELKSIVAVIIHIFSFIVHFIKFIYNFDSKTELAIGLLISMSSSILYYHSQRNNNEF